VTLDARCIVRAKSATTLHAARARDSLHGRGQYRCRSPAGHMACSPTAGMRGAVEYVAKRSPAGAWPAGLRIPALAGDAQTGAGLCWASTIRLRAQRREVLPNISASLRSDIGWPSWTLAR
jgi:hypothetical protein